jgi:aminoglycoside phosphotransferase (APT) family kinase protein
MKTKVGGLIYRIYPDSRVSSIKRFRKGVINETYSLKVDGSSLVLRIYPKDFWKIKKEKYLYELIREKTDVPVPKVIKTGRNYILMSKVQGKELSIKNKDLVRKAGEYLAKIHSIKFPYYGWIIKKRIKPKFRKWSDFINYDIKLKSRKIPAKYDSLKKKVKEIIEDNRNLLNIKSKPCLLHKDYHSSHIIADKNKINGIIDIEWAMSGHNEFEVAKSCFWMFDKKPELEKIFLQGYRKYGKLSKDFNERKKLYKIIVLLSSLSFSYKCKNIRWCIYNLRKLKGAVNEYNKTD